MAKLIKIKPDCGLRLFREEASKLALKILNELDNCQDEEIEIPLDMADQHHLLEGFFESEKASIRNDIVSGYSGCTEKDIEVMTRVTLGPKALQLVMLEAAQFITDTPEGEDPEVRVQEFIDSNPKAQQLLKKKKS